MNKVIVTGANGFLGKNLIKKLSDNNYFVYAIIRSADLSTLKEYKNVMYVVLDNISNLNNVLCDEKIDIFFHFAWEGSNGLLRGNYAAQIKNIFYCCDAINVAKKLKCNRFVFPESIMEYEIQKAITSDEKLSLNTLYSISKLSTHYMAKVLCENNEIEYLGVLISNIFGPGEKSERLINLTIRKLLNNEHCSFSSCEQLYDFIYIDDAINMIYLSALYGKKNSSYYIGNIKQKKLKEYLIELKDIVCKNAILGFSELPNPKTIINYDEFNTTNIYKEFNYVIKTDFRTGIKNTLEYIRGNHYEF